MMAVSVTCANCGQRLHFKNDLVGKATKCQACQNPLIVKGKTVPERDVFISYSAKDRHIADAVCAALETKKIRCWIAPRDIVGGKPWASAIVEGIDDSRAMVLIFSSNSNASVQVIREVDRAVNRTLPILPFRIEDASMSKEMEFYIGASHWLDAIDGTQEKNIETLCMTVSRLLTEGSASPSARAAAEAKKRRQSRFTPIALACTLAASLTSLALVFWLLQHYRPQLIQNITTYITYVTNQAFGKPNGSKTDSVSQTPVGDLVREGSVWSGDNRTLRITERKGSMFRGEIVSGNYDRKITGTVKDGELSWLGNNATGIKGGAGGDNFGTIKGDEIDFVGHPNVGKSPSGSFVLRLQKPGVLSDFNESLSGAAITQSGATVIIQSSDQIRVAELKVGAPRLYDSKPLRVIEGVVQNLHGFQFTSIPQRIDVSYVVRVEKAGTLYVFGFRRDGHVSREEIFGSEVASKWNVADGAIIGESIAGAFSREVVAGDIIPIKWFEASIAAQSIALLPRK